MMALLDGRIDCDVTEQIEGGDEYYEALSELNCPSMLMGRVTMQMHYAAPKEFVAENPTLIGSESHHSAIQSKAYLIAIDTYGKLTWPANQFDGLPLLVIVSEDCSKEYLDTLNKQHISWIATGKSGINLPRAMEMLTEQFGVERLSITGGGHINGAFLKAGLLDEVSMMWCPGIDGRKGMTAAFDGLDEGYPPTKLKLISVTQKGETIWGRYKL